METRTEGGSAGPARLAAAAIENERVFGAPRALVWEMWVKEQNLSHWLPLEGQTLVSCEGEVRPGGIRRLTLRSPSGETYGLTLTFREAAPPDRLVFGHRWDGGVETTISVAFEELEGRRTRMVFRHSGFDTPESRHAHESGWDDSFAGLARYLDQYLIDDRALAPAGDPAPHALVLEHLFDAPRALVFRLWASPEHVVRWWGPRGMSLSHCEMDFREGGSWRFCMRTDAGREHWTHGVYREIRAPERLAFTYINERDGHEMLVELDFLEEGRKTRLKFRQAEFMSVLERNAHGVGWTQTFGIFDVYLDLFQSARLTESRLGWRRGEVPGVAGDLPGG
jgi:uncharacterized protein YndB with AHSA1/START domain